MAWGGMGWTLESLPLQTALWFCEGTDDNCHTWRLLLAKARTLHNFYCSFQKLMIQKELAGKAGESANVALLIFIKEIGGNHGCNRRTGSFPSNGSHPPPWPRSAHPITQGVQWWGENAAQGVTGQPNPSVLQVVLAALQEGKQPRKAQPKTKHGQRGQIEWFRLRPICSLWSLLTWRELSCACQQQGPQGHHSTQLTQSHLSLPTGASPLPDPLWMKMKEDETQQGSGEFLSQTGPCQDIFSGSGQDKIHLIPCSLLKLQPPEQPLP